MRPHTLILFLLMHCLGCNQNSSSLKSAPEPVNDSRESVMKFLLNHTGDIGMVDFPDALQPMLRGEAFRDGAGQLLVPPGPENSCFRFDPNKGRSENYAVAYIIVKGLYSLKDFRQAFSARRVFIMRVDLIRVNGARESRVHF